MSRPMRYVRIFLAGMVNDKLKFDAVYYQTLPMVFSCSIKGGSHQQNKLPARKIIFYGAHLPVLDGIRFLMTRIRITLERGDDEFMVETEYVQFSKLKISGEISQDGGDSTIKMDVDYYGRQNSVASFTALTAQTDLVPVNAKLCKLFIDPSWAAVGTTEKTNTLRAFDIEIISGLHAKHHGSWETNILIIMAREIWHLSRHLPLKEMPICPRSILILKARL